MALATKLRKGIGPRMKAHLAALSAAALLLAAGSPLSAQSPSAELAAGHVDAVILQLSPAKDAAAHDLLCRAYYSEDHFDESVRECEAAVAAEPANSSYQRWLGSAYGQKAGHTNRFSAFGIAKKAHAAMEKAVQLDPQSADALSDLGEYCVNATASSAAAAGPEFARLRAKTPRRRRAPRPRPARRIARKRAISLPHEKEFTASAPRSCRRRLRRSPPALPTSRQQKRRSCPRFDLRRLEQVHASYSLERRRRHMNQPRRQMAQQLYTAATSAALAPAGTPRTAASIPNSAAASLRAAIPPEPKSPTPPRSPSQRTTPPRRRPLPPSKIEDRDIA